MSQILEVDVPYDPHATQRPFHEARLEHEWRALIAGTGAGKTRAGAAELIYYCVTYPESEGAVFAPTFGMLKRNIIPTLELLLGRPLERSHLIRSFNKGDMLLTWTNGSRTWFNSLEYPERAEGQSLDSVWADELRLVKKVELSLQVLQRRLRGSGGGAPICAWITTTPDHPGSDLHKFLEDPKTRNPYSKVYRMSLLDNRDNLPASFVENILRTHTGALGDRFVKGLFVALGMGSFPFDYSLHVVETVDRTKIKQMIYGVDWGWTNPAAIVAVGIDYDGRAFVLDEFYKRQATNEELIATCKEFVNDYGKGKVLCGAEEPQTIERFIRAGLKAQGWKGKREDGIRDVGSRLNKAGDGRYRLYIHSRCVNLISEMQTYDAEKKVNDHAVDGLRYALSEVLKPTRPKWDAEVF